MEHELFRYLSPGICFVAPIYLAACWAVINSDKGEPLKEFILIGGSATVPALAIPFGWYIYNCFRAFRHVTTTAYESKPFIQIIRDKLRVIYDARGERYLVDFSCLGGEIGWRVFSAKSFLTVFYPFKKGRGERLRQMRRGRCLLGYLEPVSDLLLFPNSTYNYARSISSVRYGIDSSVFAFLFGLALGLASLGALSHFVNEPPFQTFERVPLWLWLLLFAALLLTLIALTFLRREQAAREYSSRLTLITVISSDAARPGADLVGDDLPVQIREAIDRLPSGGYAAFDMDNTLLVGDIGEAVFALLLREGRISRPRWSDYQRMLHEDRRGAYVAVVEAMRGLPVSVVVEATERLIHGTETFISIEGERVPVPRPDPLMQSLVLALGLRRTDTYIVTSSSQIPAEIVAWNFFGIPAEHVIGVRSRLLPGKNRREVIDSVVEPVPYADGKVAALRESRPSGRPIVTAGDSEQDVPLLLYTSDDGIILWVGESESDFDRMRQSMFGGREISFVPRQLGVGMGAPSRTQQREEATTAGWQV